LDCVADPMSDIFMVLAGLKISSSEIPASKTTKEYVDEINAVTGLDLTPEEFDLSPLLRAVAKLFMNALIGKNSQSSAKLKKDLVYTLQEFRGIYENRDAPMRYFEVVADNTLLVHSSPDPNKTAPFTKGSLFLTSMCNSLSRQYLIESAEKLMAEGYACLYFDTDSIYFMSLSVDCRPVTSVLEVHPVKIGAWKLEYDDIERMCVMGKKTYSLTDSAGNTRLKTKGFTSLETSLADANRLDLFEQEIALHLAGNEPRDLKMFQRQFRINPTTFVIDVRPPYKTMRIIGPRKTVPASSYVALKTIWMQPSELKTLHCGKVKFDEDDDVDDDDDDEIDVSVADLSPFIPAYPFGFKSDRYQINYSHLKINK
jgi:hypothetical protein